MASRSRSQRRRYELPTEELNRSLEELVALAQRQLGDSDGADYVRELAVTALRLIADGTPRGDLKLLNSALKELRHSIRVFAPYAHLRKVAVFGSARIKPSQPEWQQAYAFAERIVRDGWMVITGAGQGIMEAAQGGAGRHASFGVNIRLPFEQSANEVIAGDHKLINFRYFFTRKVTFVRQSHAIALFPGGFGTHDEGFEALTLIQTGKSEILPVVFVDVPGGSYWRDWESYVRSHMLERGLINRADLALFRITDSVEDAVREILGFYSNYHSSRYVDGRLVIRVRRAPDASELERLNRDFADIVKSGKIEVGAALPQERGEAAQHPRVLLDFNRRAFGRLRGLIDALNALVAEEASPPVEASPHEIVPRELSPEAERDEED